MESGHLVRVRPDGAVGDVLLVGDVEPALGSAPGLDPDLVEAPEGLLGDRRPDAGVEEEPGLDEGLDEDDLGGMGIAARGGGLAEAPQRLLARRCSPKDLGLDGPVGGCDRPMYL